MCLEELPWDWWQLLPPDPGFCHTVSYIHTVKQPGLASWRQEGSQTHVEWGRQAPGVRLLVWRKEGVQASTTLITGPSTRAVWPLTLSSPDSLWLSSLNCQSKPNAMPFVMDLLHHPQTPTEGWPPPSPGSSPKIKLVLQSWLETSDIPCQAMFGLSEVS